MRWRSTPAPPRTMAVEVRLVVFIRRGELSSVKKCANALPVNGPLNFPGGGPRDLHSLEHENWTATATDTRRRRPWPGAVLADTRRVGRSALLTFGILQLREVSRMLAWSTDVLREKG